MEKKLLKLILSLGLALFVLASCVDNGYDLSKNVSLDINVGGESLSIPVGNTDSIKLSDLIDLSDMLVIDKTGQYSILKADVLDPVEVHIDPITIHVDDIEFDPVNVAFQLITSEDQTDRGVSDASFPVQQEITIGPLTAELNQASTFDVSEEVPDELSVIRTAELKEGAPSKLKLSLKFEGIPPEVDTLTFDQLKVTMPAFLEFSEEDHVTAGVLTLDGEKDAFDPHKGFSRTLTLKGFDFSGMNGGEGLETELIDGKNMLVIDSKNQVSLEGKIKTGEVTVSIDELQDVRITPLVTVDPLQVAKLTGKADPDIEPVVQSIAIDLGDDVDFLKEDAYLDLHNPQIYLVIGNTTGIPVDLTVNMYAKDDQGNLIEGSQVPEITLGVNAAETDGETTETKFLISRQGTQQEGYEAVREEELSNLLHVIPDTIVLEMRARADQDETHHIDLTKQMELTGRYKVVVPLRFDSININYKDTIDGLLDDLSDISDKVKELGVDVLTTVENSIPLELTLDVIPLDAAGNVIPGITATVSGTIPAGTGLEPVSKEITIHLTDEDDALSDLDALELNIKAVNTDGTEGGVPLNANQFVRLTNIHLQIDGGLNLDLND